MPALDAATPPRISSESPGKKNPMSRPVSAKMMASRPIAPTWAIRALASSRVDTFNARVVVTRAD